MIGRRVIGHFKNQQWTAFGIEFVIVVLGIFIGLQVSNWNQERTVGQQAANFAERLKTDLREEDWAYQLQITYNREVLANAQSAAGVDAHVRREPEPEGPVPVPASNGRLAREVSIV